MTDAPAGLQNSAAVGVDYAAPGTDPPVVPEPKQAAATPKAAAGFDPGEHTVAEVQAYIDKHPDQADAILAAEKAGKSRATLVGD